MSWEAFWEFNERHVWLWFIGVLFFACCCTTCLFVCLRMHGNDDDDNEMTDVDQEVIEVN